VGFEVERYLLLSVGVKSVNELFETRSKSWKIGFTLTVRRPCMEAAPNNAAAEAQQ
jgi:hypothetical protein